MGRYRVRHHLRLDGKEYGPGDKVSLSAEEAAMCGSALVPESADEEAEQAEKKKSEGKGRKSAALDDAGA